MGLHDLLSVVLVRNSKLLTTLGTAGGKHTTTILGCHSLTETVLVHSSSVVGLKCSFHLFYRFIVIIFSLWAAKVHISF